MADQSTLLRRRAYEQIRSQLVLGKLPSGSKISEPKLAKALGIGRTPVREAIQQLEYEGLLERSPRMGTFVSVPQRRDIIELFELREALEGYSVMLTAERITAEEVRKLYALCDVIDEIAKRMRVDKSEPLKDDALRQFLVADMGFHLVLLSAARNHRIIRIMSHSHALSRIFGTLRQDHTYDVIRETADRHRGIVDLCKKSTAQEARALMETHIRESRQRTLDDFDRKQRCAERPSTGIEFFQLPAEFIEEFDRMGVSLEVAETDNPPERD